MVYIVCIKHRSFKNYVDIIGIYLNKNMAYEKMKEFNKNRLMTFATIKISHIVKNTEE
jgi:hypothetical protein